MTQVIFLQYRYIKILKYDVREFTKMTYLYFGYFCCRVLEYQEKERNINVHRALLKQMRCRIISTLSNYSSDIFAVPLHQDFEI